MYLYSISNFTYVKLMRDGHTETERETRGVTLSFIYIASGSG